MKLFYCIKKLKKAFFLYFLLSSLSRRYFPGNSLLDGQQWPISLKGAGIQNSGRSMTNFISNFLGSYFFNYFEFQLLSEI